MRTASLLILAILATLTASACGADDDDDARLGAEPPTTDGRETDHTPPAEPEVPGEVPADPDAGSPASKCPRARVTVPAGSSLNLREMPSTDAAIVTSLPNKAVVDVAARVTGEEVSGTTEWMKVTATSKTGFISAAFAKCTADLPPVLKAPPAYYLPLECKKSARISQGNNGSVSHKGKALYGFDFAIPVNTPLVAMADGIVLYTFAETEPGEPCYNGGGAECYPYANYVVLRHGDGTGSIYKHLNKVLVSVGELVPSGTAVGLSGSTGYSTGPHAHVMRQEQCGAATSCQSVPVKFADVPGNGIPGTGQTVTSKNACPP
jgi:murein DD-endopeptidase MepM/ murein hydrolase activator NlpD